MKPIQTSTTIRRLVYLVCAISFYVNVFVGVGDAQVLGNFQSVPTYYDGAQQRMNAQNSFYSMTYSRHPVQPTASTTCQSTVSDTQQLSGEPCQCAECQQKSAEEAEAATKAAAARQAKIQSQLTGDWSGRRSALEDRGIGVRSSLTQFYQGVASGGTEQRFSYGAKFDLYCDLNTEKMGLWEGGEVLIHLSDWQFGQNAIADATFGSPVNFNLLFPEPESSFAVSSILYQQVLNEQGWVLKIGRYSLLDLWDAFYPGYGDGLDGFMNVSLLVPFNTATSGIPPISNLAGLVKAGEKGLQAGIVAFENADNSNRIGLDFPNGVTFLLFGRKYTEFGGLRGSHTIASTLSTSDFTNLDTNDWIQLPGGLPTPTAKSGQWSAGYIGEQRLCQDSCNENRYTNLRTTAYWAQPDVNPFNFSSSVVLETFGIRNRSRDRMGIGYFYTGLSNDFQNLLNFLEPHGNSVQGGEFYYNAQINPWFNLTFDLQAVSPINASRDTAIVAGIRGRINF